MKLSALTYQTGTPLEMARFFLGKYCFVRSAEGVVGGIIVESEAYGGVRDKACHGGGNRRTARTEIMFAPGGRSYVYLCYGLHHLLNFVTGPEGSPEAVLIRSLHITQGREIVRKRRKGISEKEWASGPGRVGLALGLGRHHSGLDLTGDTVWVEDRRLRVPSAEVVRTPRIGVDYAGIWAKKPWRLVWTGVERSVRHRGD